MSKKIRVLVVDDSSFFRKLLIEKLSAAPNIEVIGCAIDAFDAEDKILKQLPDVVTLDIELPGMSGLNFLKKLLPKHHVPVVMVSSLNITVFEALSTGAVDFVRKPDVAAPNMVEIFTRDLLAKVFIASMSKVPRKAPPVLNQQRPPAGAAAGTTASGLSSSSFGGIKSSPKNDSMVIAMGASTGGTEATLMVLKDLPAETPGIVVVQHMPVGFTEMYAQRLNRLCPMEVKEAQNGDKIIKGRVLIAPADLQMRVVKIGPDFFVRCMAGEKVSGHRPSVDVLFQSVAEVVGANAVGVIMTGMGQDGAQGLLAMRKKGAYTIGQDKDSCVVYGMPMVAYNIGAVQQQVACESIAMVLKRHLNNR